jgi:hypothetical protein
MVARHPASSRTTSQNLKVFQSVSTRAASTIFSQANAKGMSFEACDMQCRVRRFVYVSRAGMKGGRLSSSPTLCYHKQKGFYGCQGNLRANGQVVLIAISSITLAGCFDSDGGTSSKANTDKALRRSASRGRRAFQFQTREARSFFSRLRPASRSTAHPHVQAREGCPCGDGRPAVKQKAPRTPVGEGGKIDMPARSTRGNVDEKWIAATGGAPHAENLWVNGNEKGRRTSETEHRNLRERQRRRKRVTITCSRPNFLAPKDSSILA